MTSDEARLKIKDLEMFIETMEAYEPEGFEQEAFKLYVESGSVSKVAAVLKDKGYRIGNRKVISKDITDLIRSKPIKDNMHKMAQETLKRSAARMKRFS
ncbi:hypothetical protein ACRC6Q_16660 [Planococcus sp. SE5232]|uniref:hypothetical protein n=1 Tax=unclassified Planococcus (in: firmicutes) TaxID=2662419 RepID=UPI003D6A8859